MRPGCADYVEETVWLNAPELLIRYRCRELSPVEAIGLVLDQVGRTAALNAFCFLDEERAIAAAKASERRWLVGHPLGLLDGVPVSVKESEDVAGWPTRDGSRTTPPEPIDRDGPAVARLRGQGAVLFGKTTTPEFGWKAVTDSPLTGITRNPWNPELTPGGSSGGAAVAVATGCGPLAVGTDGGGSIRIPSAFTGVFGLKPTPGLVPRAASPAIGQMATTGPIARTVQDAALFLEAVNPSKVSTQWWRDPGAGPFPRDLGDPRAGPRIAFSRTLGYVEHVDEEPLAAVEGAVMALGDDGVLVEDADPGWGNPRGIMDVVWRYALQLAFRQPRVRERLDQTETDLQRLVLAGPPVDTGVLRAAQAEQTRLTRVAEGFFKRFDLLVTPSVPIAPFATGMLTPDPAMYETWWDWAPYTFPFNMTGQPAASCPCGLNTRGLPVALQIVGRPGADRQVLWASARLRVALAAVGEVRPP